ncbi:MAG TPA: hypothetical protein VGW34_10660 [Allosphingosinicella sp.]|nr:hypothetical protein [Allosphingosinicella sp.]
MTPAPTSFIPGVSRADRADGPENYADMRRDPVGFLRAIIDADTVYADYPAYTADAIRLLVNGEGPWRCFHCGEVCTTKEAAAEHFGEGNYEMEMPICIEAATSEMKALVLTNREMFERLRKVERDLEQAEFERDCWAEGARKFMNAPHATWHDLSNYRETADGRVLAAEAAINAAPRWLANILRRRAERLGGVRLP